ncbi:MAG: hypothetical protein AAB853_03005 [Patescibacteria group bacterium]
MPKMKSSVRLTVFKVEKTRWMHEAKKMKITLSQFVRMTMNTKLHIPTNDLARKIDCKSKEQMSIYDGGCYEHLPVMGADAQM